MTDGDADVDGRETVDESGDSVAEDEYSRESDADVGVADTGTTEAAGADTGTTDASDYTTGRRSISGRIRLAWGLRVVTFALVFGVVATAIAQATERVPLLVGPALAVVVFALGLPWVHLRYRVWAFELRDDALYLERGVLTHVKSIVPFVRIQHVDTQRGPVERGLGLSTLVVYTAGSRGADVSIPGLTPEEARDLQRRVKELAIEAEGGDAV